MPIAASYTLYYSAIGTGLKCGQPLSAAIGNFTLRERWGLYESESIETDGGLGHSYSGTHFDRMFGAMLEHVIRQDWFQVTASCLQWRSRPR
jgi:hypothetical protein